MKTGWAERDSKNGETHGQPIATTAENKPVRDVTPSSETARNVVTPSLETLRTKLDAAIVAERWDAVAAIRARIVDVERAGVIDLEAERRRRGG